MANNPHLVAELEVHPDETINLGDDLQNTSANTPTSLTTTIWQIDDADSTDVTTSVFSDPVASASGTIASTGALAGWVDGTTYHVYLQFTLDSNVLVSYWIVNAKDYRPPTA